MESCWSLLHVVFVMLQPTLNSFMSLGRAAWTEARQAIQKILHASNPLLQENKGPLIPMSDVSMHLPATIGNLNLYINSAQILFI